MRSLHFVVGVYPVAYGGSYLRVGQWDYRSMQWRHNPFVRRYGSERPFHVRLYAFRPGEQRIYLY